MGGRLPDLESGPSRPPGEDGAEYAGAGRVSALSIQPTDPAPRWVFRPSSPSVRAFLSKNMNQHITQENLDATLKILRSLARDEEEEAKLTNRITAEIEGHSLEASFAALLGIVSKLAQHRLNGDKQKAAALCLMSVAANISNWAGVTDEELACIRVIA